MLSFLALFALLAVISHLMKFAPGVHDLVLTLFGCSVLGILGFYVPKIPEKYGFPITLGVLAIPFCTLFLGTAALLCGLPLVKWWLAAALVLALCLVKRVSLPGTLKITFPCILGIWFAGTLFASLTWDFSHEGEIFQKPAAILMSQGWNPIYTSCESFLEEKGIDASSFDVTAVTYFPKGQAVINAVYIAFFGNPEAGDSVYFLMIPCCVFLFYHILQKWLEFGKYETLLLALILALSPMLVCTELFSGSIGGNLALSWTLFLLSGWQYVRTGNRKWRPFFIGACVYGCTLQFSALLFFGTVAAVYTFPYIFQRNSDALHPDLPFRTWGRTLAVCVFLLLVCGFHPYATNTVTRFSPFYPCTTFFPNAFPISDVMEPYFLNPEFKKTDAYRRFMLCNLDARRPVRPGEKTGPQQDARRVEMFSIFSSRPYGIFPFVLFSAIPLLFFIRRTDSWLVLIACLSGFFLYPYNWNEIFTPQIRVFPVLVCAFMMLEFRSEKSYSCNFLMRRGTALFRVVIALLAWSYIVSFNWCCIRHLNLAAQCSKAEVMMNSVESVTLYPVWEYHDTYESETEIITAPRPLSPFYFRSIFTPSELKHVKLCETPETLTFKHQSQLYIHTILFALPEKEEIGVPTRQIPSRYGTCYKQFVLRMRQFLFQWLPRPQKFCTQPPINVSQTVTPVQISTKAAAGQTQQPSREEENVISE